MVAVGELGALTVAVAPAGRWSTFGHCSPCVMCTACTSATTMAAAKNADCPRGAPVCTLASHGVGTRLPTGAQDLHSSSGHEWHCSHCHAWPLRAQHYALKCTVPCEPYACSHCAMRGSYTPLSWGDEWPGHLNLERHVQSLPSVPHFCHIVPNNNNKRVD